MQQRLSLNSMAHFNRHHVKETPTLPQHRLFRKNSPSFRPARHPEDYRRGPSYQGSGGHSAKAAQARKDEHLVCTTRPARHRGSLCRKRRAIVHQIVSASPPLHKRPGQPISDASGMSPTRDCEPVAEARSPLQPHRRSWPLVVAAHCGQRKQTSRKSNSSRAFPLHAKRPQPLTPPPSFGPRKHVLNRVPRSSQNRTLRP